MCSGLGLQHLGQVDGNDLPALSSLDKCQRETECALIFRLPRAVAGHYSHVTVSPSHKVAAGKRETTAWSFWIRHNHLFRYPGSRRSCACEIVGEQSIERRAIAPVFSIDPIFGHCDQGFSNGAVVSSWLQWGLGRRGETASCKQTRDD